jgi:hypothetical protein
MADSKTKRLRKELLQEDLEAYAGMKSLTGYNPANPDYSEEKGDEAYAAMRAKQVKEVQDNAQAEASEDDAIAGEWFFHDYVRNMRIQTKAQFGENSNEVQTVGLKKKSEYKSPSKKKPPTT